MRRICNLTGTDSRAPSVFIGCTSCFLGIFSSFLVNDLLAVLDNIIAFCILLVNRSYRNVAANIGCIDIGLVFQLAYIDCVCIIDTGSDMDDTAFLILITDGKDTAVIIAFQKIVNFYLAIGT